MGASAAPLAAHPIAGPAEPGAAVAIADKAARQRGDLSELAVLGTPHLRVLPDDFDVESFAELIERLAAWRPDRIATEEISGRDCEEMRRYDFENEGNPSAYCIDTAPFLASLGLDLPTAEHEAETILADAQADRPPEVRRRLAALFLASGQDTSALVQWLRLSANERRAAASLSEDMVAFLEDRQGRMSEDSLIAAPLAARLGHERIYPVDDQSAVRWGPEMDAKTYGEQIMAIWKSPELDARLARGDAARAQVEAGGDVIEWYRFLNSVESQRDAVATDFGKAAGAKEFSQAGRSYLAYWERRNMLMVANLREVVGAGNRVLAIVGASHKAYYERYMGVSSDVAIVPIEAVLVPGR